MQLYNKFAVNTRWCCILINLIQIYTNIENIYDYAVATQERERIVIRKIQKKKQMGVNMVPIVTEEQQQQTVKLL